MAKAKFVKEITVVDPDSGGNVEIAIFKHERGGMFGMDSSYVDQVLPDEGDCMIPDPFEVFEKGVYISNDGVELIGI